MMTSSGEAHPESLQEPVGTGDPDEIAASESDARDEPRGPRRPGERGEPEHHEHDEHHLPDLHPEPEPDERAGDGVIRKADLRERAGESEPMHQAEDERDGGSLPRGPALRFGIADVER